MNFTSPADFLYVDGYKIDAQHKYGDLDRIEIDNNIMPLRTGDDSGKIRGIDIAFALEAIAERCKCIGSQLSNFHFSLSLSKSEILQAHNAFVDVLLDENSYVAKDGRCLLNGSINLESNKVYEFNDSQEAYNLIFNAIYRKTSIKRVDVEKEITRLNIQNLYDNIESANYWMRNRFLGSDRDNDFWYKDLGEIQVIRHSGPNWENMFNGNTSSVWGYFIHQSSLSEVSMLEWKVIGGFKLKGGGFTQIFSEEQSEYKKAVRYLVFGRVDFENANVNPTEYTQKTFLYLFDSLQGTDATAVDSMSSMIEAVKEKFHLGTITPTSGIGSGGVEEIYIIHVFPIVELRERTRWNLAH